ncbi:hypothetical protein BN59_02831 [Legionella massiliensis]|uniref:Coiled-coil protein n=1 Tax=Legionella massiliensis TaxID=1034943 RepID=A0A078L055_9GAMM|nr:hypothetical protein [Legionella massiliensis]CDZ78521.1 hypothetical protein BN59_02831 [Legionella massiliensis]CEE14259.1 hypothetical protein BN1094_02831 [Legionella massiliensis]
MNPEQRRRLVSTFLRAKYPDTYDDAWLENENTFAPVAEAIDLMEKWGTLNSSVLNDNPHALGSLFAALDRALMVSMDVPPKYVFAVEDALLPDGDYTSRQTKTIENQAIQVNFLNRRGEPRNPNFEELRQNTLETLLRIAANQMPSLPAWDKISSQDVQSAIKAREKLLKAATDPGVKQNLENEIDLLKDINKVSQLKVINIPKEDGSNDHYCILPDAAGGVTEKYSVMSTGKAIEQMIHLYNGRYGLDFAGYTAQRDNFKLSTEGILKLPKHGKTIEVQREAIALNISRILGFTTTKSTMVEHNGQAALFVPFDKIQLMKEFAHGETHHVVLPSSLKKITSIGDEYLHYSTITPVGNQLHSDRAIEDFGRVMAFSYLCNDPDFIGMENQNKAIKDNHLLYIFDQVVMSDEKMELDSRLSLAPIGAGRHSRHNQGRNRSIVEDSSFNAKFASVTQLLENQGRINTMLDGILDSHDTKIRQLRADIKNIADKGGRALPAEKEQMKALQTQLKEVELLRGDAAGIKDVINSRMETMFRKFPTLNGQAMNPQVFLANQDVLRQSLTLEKLINKPVLFADDGRPYKNPWTYRNKNKITEINLTHDNKVELTFKTLDVTQMIAVLKSAGVDTSLCEKKGTTLKIPIGELNKVQERCMFPELGAFAPPPNGYLDINRLRLNLSGYSENSEVIIARIEKYKADLLQAEALEYGPDIKNKIENMQSTLAALKEIRDSSSSKGMVKQVELNLQLDIQENLREMIHEEEPGLDAKIAQAFEAAVKLDRVNDFNHVLMAFAYNGFKNAPGLDTYLTHCITAGQRANDNYKNAKEASLAIRNESHEFYTALNNPPQPQPRDSVSAMLDRMPPGRVVHGPHLEFSEDDEDVDVHNVQRQRQVEEHRELTVHVTQSSGSNPLPTGGGTQVVEEDPTITTVKTFS